MADDDSLGDAVLLNLRAILSDIVHQAEGRVALILDESRQVIVAAGDVDVSYPSKVAAFAQVNHAPTGGLRSLVEEREFSILFDEGERDHLHFSAVAPRYTLVISFENRSSLGLVRLVTKKQRAALGSLLSGADGGAA